ncbi:MAG: gephyrin-like molybdotransferase Glp [Polyangia bacterium]
MTTSENRTSGPAPAERPSDGHLEELVPPEVAVQRVMALCRPLGAEVVPLSEALGRVLVAEVRSGRVLPPWDNSAMDGYAVRAAEVVPGQPLPVRGVVAAGQVAPPLPKGATLRIMTGAPLPEGADSIIMKEEASEADGQVRFKAAPAVGQHVRRAGEDVALGDVVLAAGAVLGPGELGLLAALGRTLLTVHRRPQVAIVSTGDELVPADIAPGPGQIANSNAHALLAQVTTAGALGRVLPIAPDDPAALRALFAEGLTADVLISSGGVSVGEFDFVKQVLGELGVVEHFSKVAMKPGKPLSCSTFEAPGQAGAARRVLVMGLPGNPASSMVSFELFVRPALLRLLGHAAERAQRPVATVRLLTAVPRERGRLHFVRAHVRRDAEDPSRLVAQAPERQGSGMLRSMVGVNALLHVPPGPQPLAAGETVLATILEAV